MPAAEGLWLDLDGTRAETIGSEGLTPAEREAILSRSRSVLDTFRAGRQKGLYPFLDLPGQDLRPMLDFAKRREGSLRDLLVLGIGGSALGMQTLMSALRGPHHNVGATASPAAGPRVFILDNVDPEETRQVLDLVDWRSALVVVVTKSGETSETLATFDAVLPRLQEARSSDWRDRIVAVTDPTKGFLRRWATRTKVHSFEVPPAVGGRFSVLTPVGLLPAALAGLDIEGLCRGASAVARAAEGAQPDRHLALVLAGLLHHFQTARKRPIHVIMPYTRALKDLADWFRQLWAESLGKKLRTDGRTESTGPTPVPALGVTDQHSQIQLYVEGPPDKVVTFLAVDKFRNGLPLPGALGDDPSVDFLARRDLEQLIQAERRATAYALGKAGQPHLTLGIPEVSAAAMGGLFMLFELQTALAGLFYGVNPFDQPGVEAGKIATFALMGKTGVALPAGLTQRETPSSGRLQWPLSVQ